MKSSKISTKQIESVINKSNNAEKPKKFPLDIYIYGKYNLLMETIIDEINMENSNNSDIGNDSLEQYLNNLKKHKEILEYNKFDIKNVFFDWGIHIINKENQIDSKQLIISIRDEIKKQYKKRNINNSFIAFINNISELYEIINIFGEMNINFHPLFLFIINKDFINKNDCEESLKYEIKNYLNENKLINFDLRNIELLEEVNLESGDFSLEEKENYILRTYKFLYN